jgi:selenocysteine-specific elongation factor
VPTPRSTATHRVVATAGHVDHGKSTLVRALTGMEPDRLAEERRRGLTIELGYAWTTLPGPAPRPAGPGAQPPGGAPADHAVGHPDRPPDHGAERTGTPCDDGANPPDVPAHHGARRTDAPPAVPPVTVAFVDVPGHERFVGTMLAGAGAAPAALLVVAADDGWSAQSSEHRDVLELLGVPTVARVITKSDRVDRDRLAEVRAQLEAETAGGALAAGPVVVTDAVTGRGLDELRTVLADRLAVLPPEPDLGRPRLWLDRAFSVEGAGTVVTGTLTGGSLRVGDTVQVLPVRPDGDGGSAGRAAAEPIRGRVRALQSLGEEVVAAAPGTRVAVNLAGLDRGEVARGDVLVAAGPWRTTREADLWVRTSAAHTLDRSGAWHLHVGATSTLVQVRPLAGPVDAASSGVIRVRLDAAVPLVVGDRIVLRDAGRRAVVAGGIVLDPDPPALGRGRAARLERVRLLRGAAERLQPRVHPSVVLPLLVAGWGGSRNAERARAVAGLTEQATFPDGIVTVGGEVVAASALEQMTAAVHRLGPGAHARETVVAAARAVGAAPEVAAVLPDHLERAGELVRTSGGFALAEHADAADTARRQRAEAVVAALAASPFAPPDLDETARQHGLDHRELAALVGSGAVVRRGAVAFAASAVAQAAAVVRELYTRSGPFTAAEAKAAWGTTRRYAIPLLEHLDAIGVTRFDGQRRTVPPDA